MKKQVLCKGRQPFQLSKPKKPPKRAFVKNIYRICVVWDIILDGDEGFLKLLKKWYVPARNPR